MVARDTGAAGVGYVKHRLLLFAFAYYCIRVAGSCIFSIMVASNRGASGTV